MNETEEIKPISQLQGEEYALIVNDREIRDIQDSLGIDAADQFDGLIVREEAGDFAEVWGFNGSVPGLWKLAYRIK
jgi:hypothetical protein